MNKFKFWVSTLSLAILLPLYSCDVSDEPVDDTDVNPPTESPKKASVKPATSETVLLKKND